MSIFFFLSVAFAQTRSWCPFCNDERVGDWQRSAHADFLNESGNPFPDKPIFSSRHFVVYVTKGAFTPHYFLVVARKHYERVADLPAEPLADLAHMEAFFARYYRDVLRTPFVLFEHGPLAGCGAGAGGGGCIDHLHVHLLPFAGRALRGRVAEAGGAQLGDAITLRERADLRGLASYVYLRDVDGAMLAYPVVGEIPSQFMRQIVALETGAGDRWNWRESIGSSDFLVNSLMTFHALALYRELGPQRAAERIACHRLLGP